MDELNAQDATPTPTTAQASPSLTFDPRDLIPNPIFCATPEGRLVWMNASAEALTGRTVGSIAGQPFSILFPEDRRTTFARPFLRMKRRGLKDLYVEAPLATASNGPRWVGMHVRLATAGSGRSAYVCSLHDLQEIHSELETLRRRNRELGARLDEAAAGVELKSEFLATVSHELRAPMNGVIGMSRLLLDSGLDRDQRMWAEVIHGSGQQLVELVDDLLDYSRIESGQLEIGSMDFDLRVTLEAVESILGARAQERGIAFSSLVHHRVPSHLNGDPGRLRQILLHLGATALDSGGGEVQLRVDLVEETAHQAVVRFWVNVIGGSSDTLGEADALLATFAGEAGTEAARKGGRALGLAISRRLVALMGGDSGHVSVSEMGSRLWFRVPFGKQAERPVAAPAAAPEAVSLAGRRVLVADVSSLARAEVAGALRDCGCEVTEVEDGFAALERLMEARDEGRPFDAAFADLELPELDAGAFAHAVHTETGLGHLPLVLLTNLGRQGDALRAEGWGYAGYFVKPVEDAHLRDGLAEVLRRGAAGAPAGAGAAAGAGLVTRHSVAEARRSRVRVLVVEDNALDQLVILSALRRVGYAPEAVASGADALAAVAKQPFDIVFMDLMLPGDDGVETARRMREAESQAAAARTPIIALTGRVRDDDRERCLAAGMDDFMSKPVDLEALCSTVERWVRGRDEQREPATVAASTAPAQPAEPQLAEPQLAEPQAAPATDCAAPASESTEEAPAPPATIDLGDTPRFDPARLETSSMGNPEIRNLLVQAFVTRVRQPFERLRQAAEAKDAKALEFQAHAMRGMCASIGASRCALLLGRIEDFGGARRLDEVAAHMSRLGIELAEFEDALRAAGTPPAGGEAEGVADSGEARAA